MDPQVRLDVWVLHHLCASTNAAILSLLHREWRVLTQKRMPFGLKGSPATFHLVTSENLSNRLPRLDMELIVDDSGMAGNDFNDMMR